MNICFNGIFLPGDQPILPSSNSSFKWGDGLFETMKFHRRQLVLENLHFERLFISLQLLEIEKTFDFTQDNLRKQVAELCRQNNCSENARIRLAIYRTNGNQTGYVIEAVPLDNATNQWNIEGIVLGLYPYARKATDAFANLKSANFLPYVLAKRYAEVNRFDDAIVLNTHSLLCDTSKANIFLVSKQEIYTPALHQGCVNGTMRRTVIDVAKNLGFRIHQDEVTEEQLLHADEVFLTNAIHIIRWVRQYKERPYTNVITRQIFEAVTATIF